MFCRVFNHVCERELSLPISLSDPVICSHGILMAMAITGLKLAAVFAFIMLIDHAQAVQHAVGGTNGWTLGTLNYSQWAAQTTYKVGDTLLFVYTAGDHTVLQVSKADYDTCNAAAPIKSYITGKDVVPLPTAGSYWFICGVPGHCPIMAFGITVTAAAAPSPPPKATPAPPPRKASSPPPKSSTPVPSPTTTAPSPSSTGVAPSGSTTAPSSAKSGSPVNPPVVLAPAPPTTAPPPSPSGSSPLLAKPRGNAYMLLLGTIALLVCSALNAF